MYIVVQKVFLNLNKYFLSFRSIRLITEEHQESQKEMRPPDFMVLWIDGQIYNQNTAS